MQMGNWTIILKFGLGQIIRRNQLLFNIIASVGNVPRHPLTIAQVFWALVYDIGVYLAFKFMGTLPCNNQLQVKKPSIELLITFDNKEARSIILLSIFCFSVKCL
ncbi:uncharacterized protein LOC107839719 isoform X2 [Capsicum annuum]|uniref:uncharacterized protein LOC107839719 isoform X2 n=1 Tax=Capsicum annuum TaxID=4072 RepID=UPI001FB120C8|nr:uncharacterized protein LOC107839719 isoform X2 [Capsicum annuum]